jgi:hypothetical protein
MVMGDEYCDVSDRLSVQLDSSVASSGIKKIKIRSTNSDPKLRTCSDCQNIDAPECLPDYVDSNEIIVYLRNTNDVNEPGYDLIITEVRANQGSNGRWDLGENAWYDDETAVVLCLNPGNQIVQLLKIRCCP